MRLYPRRLRDEAMVMPLLWALLGAGVGGFLGAEALSYGSVTFAVVVLLIPPLGLGAWAKHKADPQRWKDAAGYLVGTGLLGGFFAIPQVISSGLSNGPVVPAALYAILLFLGLAIYVSALRTKAGSTTSEPASTIP